MSSMLSASLMFRLRQPAGTCFVLALLLLPELFLRESPPLSDFLVQLARQIPQLGLFEPLHDVYVLIAVEQHVTPP